MLFKLVSYKPRAYRELALRPPRPEKLKIFLISPGYEITIVINEIQQASSKYFLVIKCCSYRDTFYFVGFFNSSEV